MEPTPILVLCSYPIDLEVSDDGSHMHDTQAKCPRNALSTHLQASSLILERLVIEQAMAETLELRVAQLVAELLAHALRILGPLHSAGAIPSSPLEPFFHRRDDFLVGVVRNLHRLLPF